MTDEREADICVDGPESRPLSQEEKIEQLGAYVRVLADRLRLVDQRLTELSERVEPHERR